MVNGRITVEQMDWLQARADELDGNLSAALRQAISDARLLEMARQDYKRLRAEHPEFKFPREDDVPETRFVETVLALEMADVEDLELRREESGDG